MRFFLLFSMFLTFNFAFATSSIKDSNIQNNDKQVNIETQHTSKPLSNHEGIEDKSTDINDANNENQLSDNVTQDQDAIQSTTNNSQSEQQITNVKQKPLIWFVGGSAGTQIGLKYNNEPTRFLTVMLNGGLFYHFGFAHGMKVFLSASYNTLGSREYFSAGGGLDYFYDFESLGVGLFLGVYADMPIATSLLKKVDVIASAGASYSINKKNRIDVRCGYPIMQDPSLKRTLSILVSYQYLFNTK